MSNTEAEKAVIIAAMIANKHFTIDEAEAYLNAYTEQQVREARIDELERIRLDSGNGIKFLFDSYPYNNGWASIKKYIPYRIAELTKGDTSK